jgi:hypothetical protein
VARDIDGLEEWYIDNAGRQSAVAMLNMAGTRLTITDAWLAANLAGPNVEQEADGRWIVHDVHCHDIRVGANNVTIRDCLVELGGSGLYAITSSTSGAVTNPTGIIIEYCTIDGGDVLTRAIHFPNASASGQITIRYCDIGRFQNGVFSSGGMTCEYTYVHDLFYSGEAHNTSMSNRGRNCILRRNLCMNDVSSITMYAETTPYTGILVEENIIDAVNSNNELSFPSDKIYHVPQPGETRRSIGNLLARNTGMNNFENWTEITGNIDFAGNPVIEG